MNLLRTPSLLVLAAFALPVAFASAGDTLQLTPEEVAFAEAHAKLAAGIVPKELNQNCGLTAPLPTTPTGDTYTFSVNDQFFGAQHARFTATVWRKDCPDGDKQLMLTLTPPSGGTNLNDLFTVRQGSSNYNTFLVRDAAGTRAPAALPQTATYLLRFIGSPSATFDDDAALTVRYLGLGSGGSVDVPSATTTGTPPGSSVTLNDSFDGSWFNPAFSSQGLLTDVDASANIVSGAWFTADPQSNEREWFTFLGVIEGSRSTLTLFRSDGVRFMQNATTSDLVVGQATIEFTSCTEGTFEFDLIEYGVTGEFPIQKLTTSDSPCTQ